MEISAKSRLPQTIKEDSDSEIEIMEVSGPCVSGSNLTGNIESLNKSSLNQFNQRVSSNGSQEFSFLPNLKSVEDIPHVLERSNLEMDQSVLVVGCVKSSSSTSRVNSDEYGDESYHPCSFCKFNVPASRDSSHLKEHYDFLFKCNKCQLGFEEFKKIQIHVETCHKGMDGKIFWTLIDQPDNKFLEMLKCGVVGCGRKFMGQQQETDLIEHIEKNHGYRAAVKKNILNLCRICENTRVFAFKEDLEDHIKNQQHRELFAKDSSFTNPDVRQGDDSDEGFYTESSCKKKASSLKTKMLLRKKVTTEKPREHFQWEKKLQPLSSESMGKSNSHPTEEEKTTNIKSAKCRTLSQAIDERLKANSSDNQHKSKTPAFRLINEKPKLLNGVDTATINDLLDSVATATVVASTIEEKVKRNKTKFKGNSRCRTSEIDSTSSNVSETDSSSSTTSNDSETDSKSSSDSETNGTSSSDSDVTKKGLKIKLGKRKRKKEQNGKTKVCHANKKSVKRQKITDKKTGLSPGIIPDLPVEEGIPKKLLTGDARIKRLEIQNETMLKLSMVEKKIQQKLANQKSSEKLGICKTKVPVKTNSKLPDNGCNLITQLPEQGNKQKITEKKSMNTSIVMHYCPFCEKLFPDEHSLGGHIYDEHGPMLFRCKTCTSGFVNTQGLLNHMKTDHYGHSMKGLPEELIGNNSLVEMPVKFLQKIICTQKSCSLSSEIGRNGLWLGRDMEDVKAKIVDHNLLTHKIFNLGMSIGEKIELRCRACSYGASGNEDRFNRWHSHFAHDHSKLLSLQSGLDRKIIAQKKTDIIKPAPTGTLFVGGISFMTKQSELHQLFSKFGNVQQTRLILDNKAGVSKGYGFVTFETEDEAERLLHGETKNIMLNGRKLKIDRAINEQKILN